PRPGLERRVVGLPAGLPAGPPALSPLARLCPPLLRDDQGAPNLVREGVHRPAEAQPPTEAPRDPPSLPQDPEPRRLRGSVQRTEERAHKAAPTTLPLDLRVLLRERALQPLLRPLAAGRAPGREPGLRRLDDGDGRPDRLF